MDFLQTLVSSLGKNSELNPSLNALHTAFIRRKFTERFRNHGQSIELDTLLNQHTKSKLDDDGVTSKRTAQDDQPQETHPCHAFQRGSCNFKSCRYQHKCVVCDADGHGAIACPKKGSSQTAEPKKEKQWVPKTKPPHPRYRRDRAGD